MWTTLRYGLDRFWHRRSRASELRAVRRLLLAEAGPGGVSAQERRLGAELRERRLELVAMLGVVRACAGCARDAPQPVGPWPGGHCCGGRTEALFDPVELGALRLAGTRPGHLRAPRTLHAGCCFRGPRGCSLRPEHRPNRCIWYLCNELQRELHGRGALDEVEAASKRLAALLETFARLRAERLELEFTAELARHAGLHLPPE